MLNWLHPQKSDAVEQARARAQERARAWEQEQRQAGPSRDGLVVEEVSPEEFVRLFQQANKRV